VAHVHKDFINAQLIAPVALPASCVSALVCVSLQPLHEIWGRAEVSAVDSRSNLLKQQTTSAGEVLVRRACSVA